MSSFNESIQTNSRVIRITGRTNRRNIPAKTIEDIKKKFNFINEFYNYLNNNRFDNNKKKAIIYALIKVINKTEFPVHMNNASDTYLEGLFKYITILYPNISIKYRSNMEQEGGLFYSKSQLKDTQNLFRFLKECQQSLIEINLNKCLTTMNKIVEFSDFVGGNIYSQKYLIIKDIPSIIQKLNEEKEEHKISNSTSLFHRLGLSGRDFDEMQRSIEKVHSRNSASASVSAGREENNSRSTRYNVLNERSVLFGNSTLRNLQNKSLEDIIHRIKSMIINGGYTFNIHRFRDSIHPIEKEIILHKLSMRLHELENMKVSSSTSTTNGNNNANNANNWEALAENDPIGDEIKIIKDILQMFGNRIPNNA